MPAITDPGMAFVIVQHLSPDYKSSLAELIQHKTRLPVSEITDGMTVSPNCVYVCPPGCDVAFLSGTLQLMETSQPRSHHLPVDFFFHSLAQDLRERAIGIVLSGTGSDGSLGLRTIKAEGGMVMAQNPASAEYGGMPNSAIRTGLVDYELPPAEMPGQLISYVTQSFGMSHRAICLPMPESENALKKIFILLRAQSGHDFSQYKPSNIQRRIERRMALQKIDHLDGYLRYLQQNPAEVTALFQDILISVTHFFRDPEAFEALEKKVIPKLFADKPPGTVIRVWVPGCATGEEAYSIAILLQEHLDELKKNFKVQVFATDIDTNAVSIARAGVYPASITEHITPERLTRFFAPEPGGRTYRLDKTIRDMLIFSEQNVIKDPPFSKLDLISCRNLLIYMNGDLQKRIIPLFHYALAPGGFLFLSTSETVGEFTDLFIALDRKMKLYQRKEGMNGLQRTALGRLLPLMTAPQSGGFPKIPERPASPKKMPLRELTETALLEEVAPAAALVSDNGDILYLHGRTGLYLEPAPGEAGVNNILKMAREGLRQELGTTLHTAVSSKEMVRRPGIHVKTNGDFALVDLTVRPVVAGPGPTLPADTLLFLVILAPAQPGNPVSPDAGAGIELTAADADAHIASLRQELWAKEGYLRAANEELAITNEELKSANEEMQSVNEEMQSTNEELETSKEELQSVNEELATVNAELQTKVADLSRANNDMNNLLAGTGIGTIFVDHRIRILRFTPAATRIINLIQSDVGRPLGHIVSNIQGDDRLIAGIRSVLDTLAPQEAEVQTLDKEWYMMRIQPYRTLNNVIEGAVITFVNITELKKTKDSLAAAAARLRRLAVVVRDANDAMTVQDLEGRILAWNPAAEKLYGWTEAEAMTLTILDCIPGDDQEREMGELSRIAHADVLASYRTRRVTKDGRVISISMTATALLNDEGEVHAIATTERAID